MKSFLTFVAGIGLGVAISWVHHKNKYENMVQEEVESLRDMKKKDNVVVEEEQEDNSKEGMEVAEEIYEEHLEKTKNKYQNIINYNGYSKEEIGPCEQAASKNPLFVITPEEFASQLGYDTDTFYIFEDDIIANDNNEIIDNVKEMFGLTAIEIRNQFGVYEDDSVYIRDERIQMDYEILRELDTYEKRNGE